MVVSAARISRTIVAAALAVGMTAGLATATAAQAAPARRPPVVYQGMAIWFHPRVRPRELVLGADAAVTHLSWSHWNNSRAEGRGRYLACAGAAGPCVNDAATLTLTHVRKHSGTRYFATLKLALKHHKTRWLTMRGGTWRWG
jgi:hypothetical protein